MVRPSPNLVILKPVSNSLLVVHIHCLLKKGNYTQCVGAGVPGKPITWFQLFDCGRLTFFRYPLVSNSLSVVRIHHLLKKGNYAQCVGAGAPGKLITWFRLWMANFLQIPFGLQFPVSRIHRLLKKGNYTQRVGAGAPGWTANFLQIPFGLQFPVSCSYPPSLEEGQLHSTCRCWCTR